MHASAIAIVSRAARKPYQDPHGGQLRGPVTGGTHVGGGRSVAPRRDEEANPDQTAYGDTVSPRLDPPEPEHALPDPASSRDR